MTKVPTKATAVPFRLVHHTVLLGLPLHGHHVRQHLVQLVAHVLRRALRVAHLHDGVGQLAQLTLDGSPRPAGLRAVQAEDEALVGAELDVTLLTEHLEPLLQLRLLALLVRVVHDDQPVHPEAHGWEARLVLEVPAAVPQLHVDGLHADAPLHLLHAQPRGWRVLAVRRRLRQQLAHHGLAALLRPHHAQLHRRHGNAPRNASRPARYSQLPSYSLTVHSCSYSYTQGTPQRSPNWFDREVSLARSLSFRGGGRDRRGRCRMSATPPLRPRSRKGRP
mmetsp:Transcript_33304/g.81848  ORF Transcript_33304/g.81848 Transcript_33304/m.81848 type:complete len:278 (-) Transcript_33304:53-886(-)